MCMSEIMCLVGETESEGWHCGVLQRQQKKRDAIEIADKTTVKGKQTECAIILKGNGLQAPATLLTPLKEK